MEINVNDKQELKKFFAYSSKVWKKDVYSRSLLSYTSCQHIYGDDEYPKKMRGKKCDKKVRDSIYCWKHKNI